MKRSINIFFHNIRELKRNKKIIYRFRFLILSLFFLTIISFGLFSLIKSYASFQSNAKLSLDIQTAMYVVDVGEMSFNIDLDRIVPSEDPYIYTFSISNFDSEKRTDVDLEYTLSIQTTTNLPLKYRLYYDGYNLAEKGIITSSELRQDEDDSWYNYFNINQKYEFTYKENQTNIYYLVIDFPVNYKDTIEYSDAVENIQVIIDSKQIL
ncbi:MAG: hypothetical protein IJN90_01055 [Bacilli bacterium]|nr:hypothetical protein [Bacilli bacterium]